MVLTVLAAVAACTPAPAPAKTIQTTAFRLHFPTAGTAPKPLVVVLGATGRSQAQIVQVQNQDLLAEQQGYVAAYVQAPNAANTWWTGPNSSCVAPYDGTAYLRQQVAAMRALVPSIDPHRIYVEGW